MIDWHCHLLPNLDDGPTDVSESILMATRLVEFGYKSVCCTPHCIKGYYDLKPERVREATLMLQADLDTAGIELDLWTGTEYYLDEYLDEYADNLLPLGETKLVLCEAPQDADAATVVKGLELIIDKGYFPLVAHPERSTLFCSMLLANISDGNERVGTFKGSKQVDTRRAASGFRRFWPFNRSNSKFQIRNTKYSSGHVLPEGTLFQGNLGSFSGYYGKTVQENAYRLLPMGCLSGIATDLHDFNSCNLILRREKIENNPLLNVLSSWSGVVNDSLVKKNKEEAVQQDLFL